MVVHVVLFRPKPDVGEPDRTALLDAIATAAKQIPSVRRFVIGARFTHGAAYEHLEMPDFPYMAMVEFDDPQGLEAYLDHPLHKRLGELFYQLQDAALAYDYAVNSVSAPERR